MSKYTFHLTRKGASRRNAFAFSQGAFSATGALTGVPRIHLQRPSEGVGNDWLRVGEHIRHAISVADFEFNIIRGEDGITIEKIEKIERPKAEKLALPKTDDRVQEKRRA